MSTSTGLDTIVRRLGDNEPVPSNARVVYLDAATGKPAPEPKLRLWPPFGRRTIAVAVNSTETRHWTAHAVQVPFSDGAEVPVRVIPECEIACPPANAAQVATWLGKDGEPANQLNRLIFEWIQQKTRRLKFDRVDPAHSFFTHTKKWESELSTHLRASTGLHVELKLTHPVVPPTNELRTVGPISVTTTDSAHELQLKVELTLDSDPSARGRAAYSVAKLDTFVRTAEDDLRRMVRTTFNLKSLLGEGRIDAERQIRALLDTLASGYGLVIGRFAPIWTDNLQVPESGVFDTSQEKYRIKDGPEIAIRHRVRWSVKDPSLYVRAGLNRDALVARIHAEIKGATERVLFDEMFIDILQRFRRDRDGSIQSTIQQETQRALRPLGCEVDHYSFVADLEAQALMETEHTFKIDGKFIAKDMSELDLEIECRGKLVDPSALGARLRPGTRIVEDELKPILRRIVGDTIRALPIQEIHPVWDAGLGDELAHRVARELARCAGFEATVRIDHRDTELMHRGRQVVMHEFVVDFQLRPHDIAMPVGFQLSFRAQPSRAAFAVFSQRARSSSVQDEFAAVCAYVKKRLLERFDRKVDRRMLLTNDPRGTATLRDAMLFTSPVHAGEGSIADSVRSIFGVDIHENDTAVLNRDDSLIEGVEADSVGVTVTGVREVLEAELSSIKAKLKACQDKLEIVRRQEQAALTSDDSSLLPKLAKARETLEQEEARLLESQRKYLENGGSVTSRSLRLGAATGAPSLPPPENADGAQ